MANIVEDKSVRLALKIIKLSKRLMASKEFILSRQLMRSGTSVGANIREAQSAVSKKDFVNKLNIALKELRETRYWLELMIKSKMIEDSDYDIIDSDCIEIKKLLNSIIVTTKQRHM